ncbi:MAG: flagellar basal-body MS-ring/collar protein FliF [Aquabacterium sp.]
MDNANALQTTGGPFPPPRSAGPTPAFGLLSTMPLKAKLMLAGGTVALIAVLMTLVLASRDGRYAPLFAQLSDKDAAAVTAQLTQMQVPYRIAEGSGLLMVPAERIPEVKLKLAQANLPKGTASGYELMDNQAFGQSQQQERNTLKRALEGELVRSIGSLAAVSSARVHLAMPSQNGFYREQQKPSASVLVTLHAGRVLDRTQVAGIVHLVSSSVPELSPKAVSVLDQNANLLSGPGEGAQAQGLDHQQLQYKEEVEQRYLRGVMAILEPVLGRENVRATVTADVDFTQKETTQEAFKPNQGGEPAAIRSQNITEQNNAGQAVPAGVPGSVSNQPPAAAAAPAVGGSAPTHPAQHPGTAGSGTRRDNAVNYELDKAVTVRRDATGVVRRLNTAVLVNHRSTTDPKGKTSSAPLPQEELDKLTQLVQESIGFSKDRGDSVKVVNIPFRVETPPKVDPIPLWQQPWLQDLLRAAAAPLALLAVALMLVFSVIKPALRAAVPPPEPETAPGNALNAVVGGPEALPAPDGSKALALEAPAADKRLEDARLLAKSQPAAVALVMRDIMDGRTPAPAARNA